MDYSEANGYMPLPDADAPRGYPRRVWGGPLPEDEPEAEQMEMVVFFARHAVSDGAPGADFINPLHEKAVAEFADLCPFKVSASREEAMEGAVEALHMTPAKVRRELKLGSVWESAQGEVSRDDVLRNMQRNVDTRLREFAPCRTHPEPAPKWWEWEVKVEALRVAREFEAVVTAAQTVFFMGEDEARLLDALGDPVLQEALTRARPRSKAAIAGWFATGDDRAAIAAHMGVTQEALRVHLHNFFRLARQVRVNA
jgi:hypothetical protein